MNKLMALFATLMALPTTSPVVSRREMLAQKRQTAMTELVLDESGAENPIVDIAIGFILIAIALVLALVVFPIVADSVAFAQASANVTGSTDTILGLIPLILAVVLLSGAVVFLVRGFKGLKQANK